jgi:glycyl-tRNA synthetase alpha chain
VTDFQTLIRRLEEYWARQGCVILQPYDTEVGAATFCPATFFMVLGPGAWRTAHVQPCRRPTDGRYGENPFRFQRYYQFQVILKPAPENSQELYLGSLEALGIDLRKHDIRFEEDDWESPTLGAAGLGWQVSLDGMEVTQYTYFQQLAGIALDPVSLELTYGLERIGMYLQGADSAFDMAWVAGGAAGSGRAEIPVTWGDVSRRIEREFSTYNFEASEVETLKRHFEDHARTSLALCRRDPPLPLPAYDACIHASHCFNLLDARGAIGVNQRAQYIGRVRELAKTCAETYLATPAPLGAGS